MRPRDIRSCDGQEILWPKTRSAHSPSAHASRPRSRLRTWCTHGRKRALKGRLQNACLRPDAVRHTSNVPHLHKFLGGPLYFFGTHCSRGIVRNASQQARHGLAHRGLAATWTPIGVSRLGKAALLNPCHSAQTKLSPLLRVSLKQHEFPDKIVPGSGSIPLLASLKTQSMGDRMVIRT